MMMVVLMSVTMLVQPINAAFFYDDPEGEDVMSAIKGAGEFLRFNILVDCIFLVDILVNFRSAFVDIDGSSVRTLLWKIWMIISVEIQIQL